MIQPINNTNKNPNTLKVSMDIINSNFLELEKIINEIPTTEQPTKISELENDSKFVNDSATWPLKSVNGLLEYINDELGKLNGFEYDINSLNETIQNQNTIINNQNGIIATLQGNIADIYSKI